MFEGVLEFTKCIVMVIFAGVLEFTKSWIDSQSPEEFLALNVSNSTDYSNVTGNATQNDQEVEQLSDLILMGVLSVLLGLMILVTVIGESSTFKLHLLRNLRSLFTMFF